ncbi:MAG: S8 family serine peptidase [Gammaproteobacteria bacterium]
MSVCSTPIRIIGPACLLILTLTGCGGGGSGDAQSAAPGSFTASGTITAASSSAVDSDVNDPAAPYADNNTLVLAQDIPNPVTLGGYVNRPGSGSAGRSQIIGDTSDIYRVTLAANQTITLTIANSTAGDLDLFLGDTNGNFVNSSVGVGATESITVALAGSYMIEVYAHSGASAYTLVLGQQITTVAAPALNVADHFVRDEAVVKFRDTPANRYVKSASQLAAAHGMTTRAGARDRAMLLGVMQPAGRSTQAVAAQPVLLTGNTSLLGKWETLRAIKRLRRAADIEYAEPNYIRQSTLIPFDQLYPLQWHYPLINLPQAWDITTGSSNVTVAVIDTGVLSAHPDLQGQLVTGYDFISDPSNANDGNGIDPDPSDPGDSGVGGSSYHGTHVAGTVAAATNNNDGVAGSSWATRIMPLRVLGLFGGTSYDIRQALRYAAGLSNDSGTTPAQPADVINLSLGGEGFSQQEQDLLTLVRNQGTIVIAAAGNNASSVPFYPASYNGVVSVSAVDINRQRAPYSNFSAFVDVAAPGGDATRDVNGDGNPDAVLSTGGEDSGGSLQLNYRFLQGTSMAAPHVAGVVALMKAVAPGLTPVQLDNLLAGGQITQDLGSPGRDDEYGFGLIDAHMAVVAAQGGVSPVPPTLVASPGALNFGSLGTSAILSVSNGGGGSLSVNSPTVDAAWLAVTTENTDPVSGIGTYRVNVARSGLAEGTYNATITVTSSANTEQLGVIMQVSAQTQDGDAGYHHVRLINISTGQTVQQQAVAATNGTYPYTFTNVAAGTYEILASTDFDNDGAICDAGEACGGYVTLDQLTPAVINGNISGLDFGTGYNVIINLQSNNANVIQPATGPGNKPVVP